MRDKILVIGGYGNVGQTVCLELTKLYPGKIIAAGRNLEKATAFAKTLQVIPMELDVFHAPQTLFKKLEDVRMVVMCIDQTSIDFAKECVNLGIDYVDVTANHPFLKQIKALHETAASNHSTAVLGVGLAPGLSTLLAAHGSKLLDTLDHIDISILLGSGDTHGVAAMVWTMNKLFDKTPKSFSKKIDFGKDWGKRTAVPLDFSDQWTLRETLNTECVWTRFAMDSRASTFLCSILRNCIPPGRLQNFLKSEKFSQWMVNQKKGSDVFILKVDAYGLHLGKPYTASYLLSGHREGIITGKVAAATARLVLESTNKASGVFYIDQLFSFEDILRQIQSPNLRIESVNLTPAS